jgi:hypothetical protein
MVLRCLHATMIFAPSPKSRASISHRDYEKHLTVLSAREPGVSNQQLTDSALTAHSVGKGRGRTRCYCSGERNTRTDGRRRSKNSGPARPGQLGKNTRTTSCTVADLSKNDPRALGCVQLVKSHETCGELNAKTREPSSSRPSSVHTNPVTRETTRNPGSFHLLVTFQSEAAIFNASISLRKLALYDQPRKIEVRPSADTGAGRMLS